MPSQSWDAFLRDPAPGFWCYDPEKKSGPRFLAAVTHHFNPPAPPDMLGLLTGVPAAVAEPLAAFYRQHNGFTLYQDTLSETAGIRLFPIEEWHEKSNEVREEYEDLTEEEDPDHVVDGLVIGEVPESGNYFVIPVRGSQIGKVFYLDHDGWYEVAFADDFPSFLQRIVTDPAKLLADELGCYTRYSDGTPESNWIPKTYVSDIHQT